MQLKNTQNRGFLYDAESRSNFAETGRGFRPTAMDWGQRRIVGSPIAPSANQGHRRRSLEALDASKPYRRGQAPNGIWPARESEVLVRTSGLLLRL